jgi:hypothetical protein
MMGDYYCDVEKTGCVSEVETRCRFYRLDEEHVMSWRFHRCKALFIDMVLVDIHETIVKDKITEW